MNLKNMIYMKFKLLTKKFKANLHDYAATVFAVIVAIAQAWITIDWTTFVIEKEYPKLILSAIIALGGYISKFKNYEKKK